jgi:hypothetical protein
MAPKMREDDISAAIGDVLSPAFSSAMALPSRLRLLVEHDLSENRHPLFRTML